MKVSGERRKWGTRRSYRIPNAAPSRLYLIFTIIEVVTEEVQEC